MPLLMMPMPPPRCDESGGVGSTYNIPIGVDGGCGGVYHSVVDGMG